MHIFPLIPCRSNEAADEFLSVLVESVVLMIRVLKKPCLCDSCPAVNPKRHSIVVVYIVEIKLFSINIARFFSVVVAD